MKDRRIWWATYKNLSTWFNNWKKTLIQLGFGSKQRNGKLILNEQLGKIINIDETVLCLDGNEGQSEGRPSAEFVDTGLPAHAYNRTSKWRILTFQVVQNQQFCDK